MIGRASLVPSNGTDLHAAEFADYKKVLKHRFSDVSQTFLVFQEEISAHHARDIVHINAGGIR